ncbi:uncharacterized protein Z518_07210 [Rhinocladiella mackenziei CBS 650.93]|uniref:Rhinocladiella mackenziei CBS 650.93 unplaced genomic scaffold supercont1.5, whole genome shotgun sequence n=1 Tax=Rhinocladiella mackenziei CBS 650.93 TaxID=1442369 RepID=A0A0D2FNL7_9EURO|nr:uncharacterized protein Z518_07210 [Rhinocladiella mackenziei CBS 650.93]KIX03657.1 hypothetical protein Z518_07210 [Rhinocladiella mackenziei CBS 650.93]
MDLLRQSCQNSSQFPQNIVRSRHYVYVLGSYARLLKKLQPRLFTDERKVCVDLWQCDEDGQFCHVEVKERTHLKPHMEVQLPLHRRHPQCRFVFVHAHKESSREKLAVTSDMMTDILSYHQITPSFVELMASFGRDAPQDFQFCGFRGEIRSSLTDGALAVPELGRSGRLLELCYSLRAIEPSTSYANWPWSVRQLAVSHSFDVKTGQSAWIVLKADKLMMSRIISATRSPGLSDMCSFNDSAHSLASSLSAHLLFCEWAAEHWRWYVNFLEKQVQDITGTKVFLPVAAPSTLREAEKTVEMTSAPLLPTRARTFTFGRVKRSETWKSITRSLGLSKDTGGGINGQQLDMNTLTSGGRSPAPGGEEARDQGNSDDDDDDDFSFDDLQRIQFIEEKASEMILVLITIVKVLDQIRGLYESVNDYEDWPADLSRNCKNSLTRFKNRIQNIQYDLGLQKERAETLTALLANRKTLLHGILEWRSMEASKLMAKQSQASTNHMLSMTEEMRELAVKTKQETVSMRIITLVTLFFLPGTFISVSIAEQLRLADGSHSSVQTLMSTDIVRFEKSQEIFSSAALKLFLTICIPMMLFTFVAWYAVYWWVNNRERVAKIRMQFSSKV